MIYTVTFNPSLDYIVGVDDFRLGATNRTSYEQMLAGGKGINVKLKNIDGTEINGMGPDIAADQVSALREKICLLYTSRCV